MNSENPSLLSAQFTTPKSKSNIHCHNAIATSEGMAQTSTSTLWSTMRGPRCIRVMSSATTVESATVEPTATAVKTTVRITTVQKNGSASTAR